LIDRSLSQVSLPAALLGAGLIVRTLADVYGEQTAQETDDATWLALAGDRGWVVLCKDDRIRRRPAELQALTDGKVRLFCLTRSSHVRRASGVVPGKPAQDHAGEPETRSVRVWHLQGSDHQAMARVNAGHLV
jgi:hypothetical protein